MKINYSEIWREIGNAFATPYGVRTEGQRRITDRGLCYALPHEMRWGFDRIRWSVDIYGYWVRPRLRGGRFWRRNDVYRAMFAYFMADIGNKGYEELIKAASND